MEGTLHRLLEGAIEVLIVKLDPNLYIKYTWDNVKGGPMRCVQLKKRCIKK